MLGKLAGQLAGKVIAGKGKAEKAELQRTKTAEVARKTKQDERKSEQDESYTLKIHQPPLIIKNQQLHNADPPPNTPKRLKH